MYHGNSIRLLAGESHSVVSDIQLTQDLGNSHPELAQSVAER